MPPNTRTIVLAYLDERLQLFEQAEALIRAQKPRRTKSATEWQMARLTKLREKLKNAWALK